MARKINPEELVDLPSDIRREILADGKMDTDRPAETPPTPRPPRNRRDETPTQAVCIAHTMPQAEIFAEELDEWGDPILDAEGKPTVKLQGRRLHRKERVSMPRWCADLMAGKDQIVILD